MSTREVSLESLQGGPMIWLILEMLEKSRLRSNLDKRVIFRRCLNDMRNPLTDSKQNSQRRDRVSNVAVHNQPNDGSPPI